MNRHTPLILMINLLTLVIKGITFLFIKLNNQRPGCSRAHQPCDPSGESQAEVDVPTHPFERITAAEFREVHKDHPPHPAFMAKFHRHNSLARAKRDMQNGA